MKRHGRTIIDATSPLTIDVRACDVKKAIPGDDHNCAIAQSLKRRKDVVGVSVGANMVYVENTTGTWIRYSLRADDRKMVKAYDQVRYFRAGKITLVPPSPTQKLGARSGQAWGSNTRTGRAKTVTNRPLRHVSAPA